MQLLRFLMKRMLFAVFAMLHHFQLDLNQLFVAGRVVVDVLTDRALLFNEVVL